MGKILILVIDDDPAMRDMIQRILVSANFDVVEAANGVAGLSLFRQHKPALVITDILMPDMDGIEALREMRRLDPQTRVIAISGGGRTKYKNFLEIAQEFGAGEVLAKPFRREQLLAAVSRMLVTGAPDDGPAAMLAAGSDVG
jgi:CheY-like chemotaxis protein